MMAKNEPEHYEENNIIPTKLAIRAMRDSGYRNTATALAELIDNSVQAKANVVEIFCIEERVLVNQRQRGRINKIAVLDNGTGMSSKVLELALQFGNGTHLDDRSGIGRFGMGLPNASISQAKKLDVWTWESGPDNAIHSYLDVDDIQNGKLKYVPKPKAASVPSEWRSRGKSFGTTGTLVVWSNFEDERLTWKGAKVTLENIESLVGRIYRKFIYKGDLRIHLQALEGEKVLLDQDVRVNDPLYLMVPSSTSVPFNRRPMFQQWGEEDHVVEIDFRGTIHKVTVRASWAKLETVPNDGIDRGSKDYGKDAAKNIGVSVVRADREIDLDSSWAIGYDSRERWWGIEIDFPPDLDEVFGVTNNKQSATRLSHMVKFLDKDYWKTEAEPGEEYSEYKRRLKDEGDPRADLLSIVDYIRDQLKNIRNKLEDQTKGRRSGTKRHDEPSVEDRASTKFKERAATGHETASDREEFKEEYKNALITDLVTEKNYTESVAKVIADAVHQRQWKVIFIEASSEMDAFFSVEQKPAVTEVVFNSSHPAHEDLLKVLDADTANATDRDLVDRIEHASKTLKMLFAAWARQEIEDMPGREKLRRMRMDWGRMARDFLTDERDI